MAMDERRLTAWLITEGVLTSDQIKSTLEEQIRLQRAGTPLDVVGVARRLKILTDEQVLTVIERTGYRPAGDAGARPETVSQDGSVSQDASASQEASASEAAGKEAKKASGGWGAAASASADASASASDAGASASGPSAAVSADASNPSASAVSTDALKPAAQVSDEHPAVHLTKDTVAGASSGARKKGTGKISGARGASGSAFPARRAQDALPVPALVGAAVLVPVIVFLFASGGGRGGPVGPDPGRTGPVGPIGGGGPTVASAANKLALDDLLAGVLRLETKPTTKAEFDITLRSLRSILHRLQSSNLKDRELNTLLQADARLTALEKRGPLEGGPTGGWAQGDRTRIEESRVDQAWATMASNFERILWLSLQQPRSALQVAAEAQRQVDLRQHVSGVIREYTAKGPDGIASLVGAEELHPVFGPGGYGALLREAGRFPAELQQSERWQKWQKIIPRFEELRERAQAYARALRRGEDAVLAGKPQDGVAAFEGGPYAQDLWWQACRKVLADPSLVAVVAARLKDEPGPAVAEAGTATQGRPTAGRVSWGKTWKERFLAMSAQHKRAKPDERPAIAKDLEKLLAETLGLAKAAFEQCALIVGVYDLHPAVFKAEAGLQPLLKEHHTLFFEGSFSRASGPNQFRELDAWCQARGYDAWRARLKPYLRLLAGANTPAARQREAQRRARAATQEAVSAFAAERVDQVEKGLGEVIEWMRQRGYAPDAQKKALDDLIARAVERAGNDVAGARLREELRGLAHKEPPADQAAQLEKDYLKQVQGVIDDAVIKSLKGVEKALAAREPGLAFDLFGYVLLLDPENDRAHKGLGHQKVDGKWLRRFEAEKLRQGLAWDPARGWIKVADRARYEKGEYWDFTADKWTTVADANRAHSDPGNPWSVQTEHFLLKSTADLPKTIEVAVRLEAFYLAMFRQYDLFFTMKGDPAALIFGVSPSQQQPLLVWFYRDEQQFRSHGNPPTGWAAGFYSGGQHASFFYDMGGSYSVTVLQHEVTHQILGETAGSGGGADSWLAEGAAVYLEDAFFRDGALTLGDRKDHSRIVAYAAGCTKPGNEHRLLDVVNNLRTSAQWDSGDISKNYRGAGAVVYFLCTFDGGRYRSDFVEFLRDAYYGRSPRFEDYFGLSPQMLDSLMQRFYDPTAPLDPGGGAAGGPSASAADLESARDALIASCGAKDVDVDQLSTAYGLLKEALRGAAEKDANAARGRAERALLSLRKKQVKVVEAACKKEQQGGERGKRYAQLQQLRQDALGVINDPVRYPDADHGKAGQPLVDEKVKALEAVWQSTPKALDDPDVKLALELLEVTEPWLAELEVEAKKVGEETAAEMRRQLFEAASCAGLAATPAEQARLDQDKKVREWNDSLTQLPAEVRDQVRILNDYRAMLGLHALAIDLRLCESAKKHSQWMEQTGVFDHNETSAARRTPADRCKLEGYAEGVGENIAFGYPTAESVHRGWYNSSGHHRNMVHASYFQIGVGKAGTYWTQNFGMGKPPL